MARHLIYIVAFSFLSSIFLACSKSDDSSTEQPELAASTEVVCLHVDDACPEEADAEVLEDEVEAEEVYDGPSCADQKIPSWDETVQGLTDRLCERCHNNNFAWNGVLLNTYEEFVKNSEGSMERIETGNLSFEMRVIDKINFLDWYENGMPKTESDCRDFSQPAE